MTPNLNQLAFVLSLTLVSSAQSYAKEQPKDSPSKPAVNETTTDQSLNEFRTPYDVLTERLIGSASKPVRFDWRRTNLQIAPQISHLAELNNFNSLRAGGLIRIPYDGFLLEAGLHYTWVWKSKSTQMLALTPYRQPARPERLELDLGVAYPLAEGVITAWPGFFPAAEMVFNAYGSFRYLIYPNGFSGLNFTDGAAAIFSPTLSQKEKNNLEEQRLGGMQIDSARYGLLGGFGTDFYFQSGIFVSSRVLVALPLLSEMTDTQLLFWYDFSLAVGLAF